MAKHKKQVSVPKPAVQETAATLKDLLNPAVLDKLKAQADQLKAEESQRKEQQRIQAAEARKSELKRLDNDFEHLLNNSSVDWRKYK